MATVKEKPWYAQTTIATFVSAALLLGGAVILYLTSDNETLKALILIAAGFLFGQKTANNSG